MIYLKLTEHHVILEHMFVHPLQNWHTMTPHTAGKIAPEPRGGVVCHRMSATATAIQERTGTHPRRRALGITPSQHNPTTLRLESRTNGEFRYARPTHGPDGLVAEQNAGYQLGASRSSGIAPSLVAGHQLDASTPPGSGIGTATVGATAPGISFTAAVDVIVATVTDPSGLQGADADGIRDRLDQLRRLEGAATAGIAGALAALDRAGGVAGDGAPSKTEWLKSHTGRAGRDAARMARLADNLDALPATANALANGTLGPDAADTIVRATRDGRLGDIDQLEADLLTLAETATPDQLRHEVRRRQQAADGAALLREERRQHALRNVNLTRDGATGMWDLHGKLSDECGTRLRTTLDAFDHADPQSTPLLSRRRPDQRLADALDQLATTALDHALTGANGGIARPHLSVVVDAATLTADLNSPDISGPADVDAGTDAAMTPDLTSRNISGPDGTDPDADAAMTPDHPAWAQLPGGETVWGGVLSPQAVRRIRCDASLSRIIMAGASQVLDVGRATRDWSEPQRRAINARDRSCRGPACSRPIGWTQIHHIHWWRHDGPTAVNNGIALCHHCHRLIHDIGWTLVLDTTTGAAIWTSPDGRTTTTQPPPTTTTRPTGPGPTMTRGHPPPP